MANRVLYVFLRLVEVYIYTECWPEHPKLKKKKKKKKKGGGEKSVGRGHLAT